MNHSTMISLHPPSLTRNSTTTTIFVLGLIISLNLLGPLISPASAHSGNVFNAFANTPPTIDGVINDDEWAPATRFTFSIPEGQATIYVMNDGRSIYFAAKVDDNTLDEVVNVALDIFTVDFDQRHDGLRFDDGEDTISLGARNRLGDGVVGSAGEIINDGQLDVDGLVSRVGGQNHFELSHPLDSGDANDILVAPGDTIGVRFILFDDSGSSRVTRSVFPAGLNPADPDQSRWADIVIAGGPPELPEIPTTLIAIVGLAVAWAAYAGYLVRKRRGSQPQPAQ